MVPPSQPAGPGTNQSEPKSRYKGPAPRSSAIYGRGYNSCGCNLRLSEVRSGSFGVDSGPVRGPLGPKPAPLRPQTTPTGPRTASNCSHMSCNHIYRSPTNISGTVRSEPGYTRVSGIPGSRVHTGIPVTRVHSRPACFRDHSRDPDIPGTRAHPAGSQIRPSQGGPDNIGTISLLFNFFLMQRLSENAIASKGRP